MSSPKWTTKRVHAAGLLVEPVASKMPAKLRLSRHGVHLFDRDTGLNVLLDEIAVPLQRWHAAPRYLSIALTNACELRCPFCYAPKTPGRLNADTVLTWLYELDQAGCLGVGFGGGEPTAHPELAWLCEQATRRTRLAVTMTTHGHRLDWTLAARLRGNLHFVRVSMDGVGETYERIRGRSFEDLRQRLDVIATIAPFGVNVVVNDRTVNELDAVAAVAAESGATELLLLPEQPVGDRPGIDADTAARMVEWIADEPKPLRLAISRAEVPAGIQLADPFGDVSALEGHAHIDARGMLRSDAYADEGVPVGRSVLLALDNLRARST